MKYAKFLLIPVLAIAVLAFPVGCALSNGHPNPTVLNDGAAIEAGMDLAYGFAGAGVTTAYELGRISTSDYENKIQPEFVIAAAAIASFHNFYTEIASAAPGSSAEYQAVEQALTAIGTLVLANQHNPIGTGPGGELPVPLPVLTTSPSPASPTTQPSPSASFALKAVASN